MAISSSASTFPNDAAGHPGWPQVEGGLREILEEVLQTAVAVLRPAEIRFRVEGDVAEDPLELGAVSILDVLQYDVDQFADVGFVALLVELPEARPLRHHEALGLEAATDAGLVAAVPLPVGLDVVVPEVRDVIQEQHHEDVVFVLAGVDDALEGFAGVPGGWGGISICLRSGVGLSSLR